MAKNYYKAPKHTTGKTITTKSHFGSHKEMVADCEVTKNIKLNANEVVCKDDQGYYITTIDRIDSGLADPNRFADLSKRIVLQNEENSEKTQSS